MSSDLKRCSILALLVLLFSGILQQKVVSDPVVVIITPVTEGVRTTKRIDLAMVDGTIDLFTRGNNFTYSTT